MNAAFNRLHHGNSNADVLGPKDPLVVPGLVVADNAADLTLEATDVFRAAVDLKPDGTLQALSPDGSQAELDPGIGDDIRLFSSGIVFAGGDMRTCRAL